MATGKLRGKIANYCCCANPNNNPTNPNPNLTTTTTTTTTTTILRPFVRDYPGEPVPE